MNSPKPLYKFLRQKNGTADLFAKAKFMGSLNKEFLNNIPTPVNLHVQLAYINGSKMHVIADTPAWATKFRYMSHHIIPLLKKNIQYFQYLKEITVSTQPIHQQKKKTARLRTTYISDEAKNCLESMAEGLQPGKLQQSLQRLAKRHKQK